MVRFQYSPEHQLAVKLICLTVCAACILAISLVAGIMARYKPPE